jgi:hypothetical protein
MTRRRLILVIGLLFGIVLLLAFKVGISFWPFWLVDYRTPIIASILFVALFLALLSPVIIEFNSDPRPLSGPGKDPRHG